MFKQNLRSGCSKFYFMGQNEKKKFKILYIIFLGSKPGGSFEPPGLAIEPPLIVK